MVGLILALLSFMAGYQLALAVQTGKRRYSIIALFAGICACVVLAAGYDSGAIVR